MAPGSVKHESQKHQTLKQISAEVVEMLAREMQILSALGLTAFDMGVTMPTDSPSDPNRTNLRMEAIGYCLGKLAETSDTLVSASAAVAKADMMRN